MHPKVLKLLSLWDLIWENIPIDRKAQGRPPITSWPGDVPTPPGPGKVFCHLTRETLERTPIPLGNWIPISQEMSYELKTGKRNHFSQFGQALTWASWQPLLLLSYRCHPLDHHTRVKTAAASCEENTWKAVQDSKNLLRVWSKDNGPHPWSMLSPVLVALQAD